MIIMKKVYYWLWLIAAFSVGTACTENLGDEGSALVVEENPFVVSKEVACQIAASLSEKSGSILRSSQEFQGKTVANVLSVEDTKSEPVMHVINYENGGFVIIAGDNRVEPILAYSETDSFPSVDEWDLPYGLSL